MERLARITFVPLDGAPPPELELDEIPSAESVASIVNAAFAPFVTEGGDQRMLAGGATAEPPEKDLHLVYVYGHAWIQADGPCTSVRVADKSQLETASALVARLLDPSASERTILVFDCCHAASFDPYLPTQNPPRMVVYGSASNEKGIALPGDDASRLSLHFARQLSTRDAAIDLASAVSSIAERLNKDGVLRGQTVRYRSHGFSVALSRSRRVDPKRRERTVSIVRNSLIGFGAVATVIAVALAWFYSSHVLLELDLAGLHSIAAEVTISASEENPADNQSHLFHNERAYTNRVRFWSPASDVILRVNAKFADGADRALAFHLNLKPGLDPSDKSLALSLPNAEEIAAHPNMALVPKTSWFHGREREKRQNDSQFWIDIRPPTVAEYEPIAEALLASGKIERDNSFMLTWRERSKAVDKLGLQQLRSLNQDLGKIFGVLESSTAPRVSAPGDIVVGLGQLPCARCPAIVTRYEAEQYCNSRHMRLPTDLEWELATRGVDGRMYPWGDKFDESRANVPGLPKKGAPPPALKPVDAYADERSPFGLVDTVGNAGDWVINDTGSYERVYMGATYSFNQEDATTFRLLPVTDSDYLMREITVRCVSTKVAPTSTKRSASKNR